MSLALVPFENWGIYQDYGWFLAVIFWSVVAAGLCSRKHWGEATPWLVAFAVTNLATPALEMVHFFGGLDPDKHLLVGLLFEDVTIGTIPALAAVFLGMAGLSANPVKWLPQRAHRLALFGLGLVAAVKFGQWRGESPIVAGALLGLAGLGIVWWFVRHRILLREEMGRGWVAGLFLWGMVFWGATTAPSPYLLGEGRGPSLFTPFAVPVQIILLAAAVSLAVAVWRLRLNAGQGGSSWPETRRALWSLAAWLGFGFVFVEWSGHWSRSDYEANLLRRARLIAAYLDRDALDAALGPKFQIGKIETRIRNHPGSILTFSRVPYAEAPAFGRLREQLKPALTANDDIWDVSLFARRQGWLALAVKWPDYPEYNTEIILTSPRPEMERMGPDGIVFAPVLEPWGYNVHALVPLSARGGRAGLGWLEIMVVANRWAAEFSRARLQAMSVLLVGVILWAATVGLRLRSVRQSEAETLATAAIAADQAKSRFLTHVSHELRTPLQGMLGHAELMAAGPLEPEQRQRLAAVLSQGVVLKRLVNDLIDLGAIQAGAFRLVPTVFDLLKLAQECVETVCPRPTARNLVIRLRYDAPTTDALVVRADAVRLRQVLLNLLGNAVKFTAAGEVSLEISPVAFAAADPAVKLHLVVRDNGPGIPAAMRAQLFKPFGTLGLLADREGAGLGLAISAAIAKEMGGQLVLLDEGPPGAAFRLSLTCERAAPPEEATTRPAVQVRWHGLAILVVDDNLLVRTWLTELLAQRGATVEAVGNGAAALQRCAEKRFDAVILDISMPGLDGWTVARRLRESTATSDRPRLVGLSAHASAVDQQRAFTIGFDAFLTKPVGQAELTAALAGLGPDEAAGANSRHEEADAGLLRRLEALYWLELPRAIEWVRAALEAEDRPALAAAAHHLKNSADIARQIRTSRLCEQLETEAADASPARLDFLLTELSRADSADSVRDQVEDPTVIER